MKTFRQLIFELKSSFLKSDTVVFAFGRFNPLTVGHQKLINTVITVAKRNKATPIIYASQTQDAKKNPLKWADKIKFMKKLFSGVTVSNDKSANTPFKVLEILNDSNVANVTMIVGSDRVKEFQTNMQKFIDKDLSNIKNFNVVSAGERDPDAEGVTGISASKMREFAKRDDFKSFLQGLPTGTNLKIGEQIFNLVKKGLGIK